MDVLQDVLQYLDTQPHVLSMMRTCKDLYEFGVKHLLHFGVHVRTEEQLTSFCKFILCSPSTRARHVRTLGISIKRDLQELCSPLDPWGDSDSDEETITSSNEDLYVDETGLNWEDHADLLDEVLNQRGWPRRASPQVTVTDEFRQKTEGAVLLADVLGETKNLEELRIGYCEELFELAQMGGEMRNWGSDRLQAAIAGLTSVRRLRIASFGLRTLSLLPTMRTPLVEVDINFYYTVIEQHPDFLDILSPFCGTLRKVTVWHVDLYIDFIGLQDNTPRFPHVHTLSIRRVDGLSLSVLVFAFPNIQVLEITDLWLDDTTYPPDVHEARDENLAVPDEELWPELQHLSGDIYALYALGLTRHVHRLDISEMHLDEELSTMLHSTLETVRPARLLLHIGYPSTGQHADPELDAEVPLEQVLDIPSSFGISHLAVDIHAPLYRTLLTRHRTQNLEVCLLTT